MNDADIQRNIAAAETLMLALDATLRQQDASRPLALLAVSKLLGQLVVIIDPAQPQEMLDCAYHAALDEMRLRATAQALHAAGLGAIMPVRQS